MYVCNISALFIGCSPSSQISQIHNAVIYVCVSVLLHVLFRNIKHSTKLYTTEYS